MGKINVLGFDVANLIAAGEVVDRPASVVKELMENSLDAGATAVTVEIQNGGIALIRVSDDGCGMDIDDLPVAVLRHATSKIKTADDLAEIGTLGFRGEALAAISSVARVRIFSKTKDAPLGACLSCEGGSVVSVDETGCATGTTVIVEELFFNVPARRKFLKKDSTETVAVTGVVEKIALSVPHISVKYIVDGELRFVTAGDGDLHHTIYALYGRQTASRTIAVDRSENGIRVHGYISEPDSVRSNRNMENFFINGRYVKSRTAAAALEQAYVSRIPAERFPFCVLEIELNPAAVDVNVHPAKLEVKFSNEKVIFDAVYYAVRSALESSTSHPELQFATEKPGSVAKLSPLPTGDRGKPTSPARPAPRGDFWVSSEEASKLFGAFVPKGGSGQTNATRSQVRLTVPGMQAASTPDTSRIPSHVTAEVPCTEEIPTPATPYQVPASVSSDVTADTSATESPAPKTPAPPESLPTASEPSPLVGTELPPLDAPPSDVPDYIIIGEAYNCYVIVQLDDRLVLIDKHAAHERILFDRLCENMRRKEKEAQMLLVPLEISLTEAERHALHESRSEIEAIGFAFEETPDGVSVRAIPRDIQSESAEEMLTTLAGRIADGSGTVESTGASYFEARLYQASCKAAIKGGRLYSGENIRWVCDRILCRPEKGGSAIKTCPHGRPVAFEIRKNSMERQFSRLV